MTEKSRSSIVATALAVVAAIAVVGLGLAIWWRGSSTPLSGPVGGLPASLAEQAARLPPPPLPNHAREVLGFREYDANCVACHGAPGVERPTWTRSMSSVPRALAETGSVQDPRQLFLIICRGVTSSGMPSFGAHRSDNQIWSTALFVSSLSHLQPQAYQALRRTYGSAPAPLSITPDAVCLHAG